MKDTPPSSNQAPHLGIYLVALITLFAGVGRLEGQSGLIYWGGPVISHVKVVKALYGPGQYLAQVTNDAPPSLADFYGSIVNSAYMDWLVEYDAPTQTIGRGSFVGSYVMSPTAAHDGSTIADADIEAELATHIDQGKLPAPDTDTVYMVSFPQGKTITAPFKGSFLAYHWSFSHGPNRIRYAVLPWNSGDWNLTMRDASHELIELVTDPDGTVLSAGYPVAWVGGGEIADICNNLSSATIPGVSGAYSVAQLWSNQQNGCVVSRSVIQDFTCALLPSRSSMYAGTQQSLTLQTHASVGAPQQLTLSVLYVTSLQSGGLTPSFSMTNCATPCGCVGQTCTITTGDAPTLTFTATGNAGTTTWPVYVNAQGASGLHTAASMLAVTANDFSLSISPASQSVDQGKSTTFTVSSAVTSGQAQSISLSVSGLPTGATPGFGSPSITAGNSTTLTISTSPSTPAALSTITVTGTAASGAHTAAATLNVLVPRMPVIPVQRVNVPTIVTRGTTVTGTVTASSAAPAGGVSIGLTSSNPAVASVPATVLVPAGATVSQPFSVTTSASVTSSTTVTITATSQNSVSASMTVAPPAYQGYHDTCDCYGTTGWAWDANQPNTPINVDIYVDGGKVGTVLANGFRQDLLNAGIGNGYHGFGYNLPTWVRAGSHTVTAKYGGTQTNLGTTPKSITCESANVVWIQPQTTAGFGPPGSLIIAGHAQNAPSGTGVKLYWRDVTAGGGWNLVGYAPPPDSTHTWYNSFPANFAHTYSVYVVYDAVNTSGSPCTYAGNNTINWCP